MAVLPDRTIYNDFAHIFLYPTKETKDEVLPRLAKTLASRSEEAEKRLRPFVDYASSVSFQEIEEAFLRAFEVQPLTTLDMGYHLFGEDYKRGAFLSHLAEECQSHGVDTRSELPDNLAPLLKLISVHPDHESVELLVKRLLGPALLLCLGEFDKTEEKERYYRKKQKAFIEIPGDWRLYRAPLASLAKLLEEDFGEFAQHEVPTGSSAFLCRDAANAFPCGSKGLGNQEASPLAACVSGPQGASGNSGR